MPGVEFAYALDLSRCIGAGAASTPASEENNQSRDAAGPLDSGAPDGQGRRHQLLALHRLLPAEAGAGGGALLRARGLPAVPQPAVHENLPYGGDVERTGRELVVNRLRLVHRCRCCVAACPYGARHFNWPSRPIPKDALNTNMHYLGNDHAQGRRRECTFCIQRVREGAIRPVSRSARGGRKFGNLLDPDSEIRYIIEHKRVLVLKEISYPFPSSSTSTRREMPCTA